MFFFQQLIEKFGLPPFYIEQAGGKDNFAAAIAKFRLERTKDWANIRNILIVADNDDEPDQRFYDVCEQINKVFSRTVAPANPQESTKTNPRCTVLMIPWTGQEGDLETLCKEAAQEADKKTAGHVDQFLAVVGADAWKSVSRYGKAWLRSNLAVRCKDPFVPLGEVFNDPRHAKLVPITVKIKPFKRIADFISGLEKA